MKYFVIHTQKGTPTLKEFASEKTRDTFIRDFLLANQLSEDTIDYIGEGRIARAEEYFGKSEMEEGSENSTSENSAIFKVGDFVKCIQNGGYENWFAVGQYFKVSKYSEDSFEIYRNCDNFKILLPICYTTYFIRQRPDSQPKNSAVTDPHPELPANIVKNRKEFGDFLKSEGAYEGYCENFDEDFGRLGLAIEEYITSAFDWGEQREGGHYWMNLDNKWRELCTQP